MLDPDLLHPTNRFGESPNVTSAIESYDVAQTVQHCLLTIAYLDVRKLSHPYIIQSFNFGVKHEI